MSKNRRRYNGEINRGPIRYIFEEVDDENGLHYSDDALLYQDILEYSYLNPNFKKSELDNWLVRNNRKFVNDYKDISTRGIRYSKRVHNKQDKINPIFNNLLSGELITKSGTKPWQKHKNLDVEVYSSKKLGEVIWLVIKSMNLRNETQQESDTYKVQAKTNELTNNNHRIYQLILSMVAKGNDRPYTSTMLEIFFNKLENKGLFATFVNYLAEICNSSNEIYDITSLAYYVLDYMINEAQDRNLFIDLWYESANKLDSDSKELFLYESKLNVEQKVINNIVKGRSSEYEKQWFVNRADYQTIVLEGNCEKCKHPNVIMLSHDDYRNLVKNNIIDGMLGSKQKFDCKYCNSKNCVVISTF